MKHRPRKLKYEHNMIRDLRAFLESIESWPEIQGIIPGAIRPIRSTGALQFHIQYDTSSGIKCLAKSGTAVQEVFLITTDRNALRERLTKYLNTSLGKSK